MTSPSKTKKQSKRIRLDWSRRWDNGSGYTGVRLCQDRVRAGNDKCWKAYIRHDGKYQHLGYYATRGQAIAVRKGAEERIRKELEKRHG